MPEDTKGIHMKRPPWAPVLALSAAIVAVVAAATAGGATTATIKRVDVDPKHASDLVERGTLPVDTNVPSSLRPAARSAGASATAAADPPLGTVRIMPVLDDVFGIYRLRPFTLRGIGQHIEVWVQEGTSPPFAAGTLDFPAGDCRNDGVRNVVTDPQIASLIDEFDTNMYPKESAAFSVPPTRDGANAQLDDLVGLPADHWAGDGDKIVTLVSNVRDTNYYDTNNANRFTYIAGFFSSQINGFLDRNVMTIDAFDWLHRTGTNPPDNPSPDACTSAPARPRLYEGVFAHEYQHLLESYEDPDEVNWINEGLSDWAQTLTGYVNPALPITDKGFDSHVQCFTGFLSVSTPVNPNPREACGPENSLTRWEDQGPGEILADYGAAYTMMELLAGRYGSGFMSSLHRGDANGFGGVDEALAASGDGKADAQSIFSDWTLAVALDGLVDDGYKILGPVSESTVSVPTLDTTVLWSSPHAYSSPGAPSNGSDYVQLRNGSGAPLGGGQVTSLEFDGASTLPTSPLAWTVDADPPGRSGDPALYSGSGESDRDEAAVTPVPVPAGSPSLTFDALWDLEVGWDFGFVQVSTDGGSTYTSIPCTDTTFDHDPGAVAEVVEKLPGFTGVSGGSGTWAPQSCSLAAYAGQNVLLAFRAINDPAVQGNGVLPLPGLWVDNVKVNGTLVSDGSSLAPFKSLSETRPTAVSNFTVTVLSIDSAKKKITIKRFPLTGDFTISGKSNVQRYVDKKADFVGVVVTYNDPGEAATQYAPYALKANGITQPGGS
jgi:hypothetical protein